MAATSPVDPKSNMSDINVTPLVDVMLVLLIIFMIASPLIQKGVEVNVPKTAPVLAQSEVGARLATAQVTLGRVEPRDPRLLAGLHPDLRPVGVALQRRVMRPDLEEQRLQEARAEPCT